jgi:hypothetical protein
MEFPALTWSCYKMIFFYLIQSCWTCTRHVPKRCTLINVINKCCTLFDFLLYGFLVFLRQGIARGSPPGTTTAVQRVGFPSAEIRFVSLSLFIHRPPGPPPSVQPSSPHRSPCAPLRRHLQRCRPKLCKGPLPPPPHGQMKERSEKSARKRGAMIFCSPPPPNRIPLESGISSHFCAGVLIFQ